MKINLKKILILLLLAAAPILMYAQPHPNGGIAPTGTNHPVGPSAPVGEGIIMLIGMAGLYGGKKAFVPGNQKDINS